MGVPKVLAMGNSPAMFLLLMIVFIRGVISAPTISNIIPHRISEGGARIAIYGRGFPEDHFNYFDKSKVTKVILKNDVSSQECVVIKYYTNTEKIECETGPRRVKAGSAWYHVYLTANSEDATNNGQRAVLFEYSRTPLIDQVSPVTGLPGVKVSLDGRFFTDQYQQDGSFDEQEDPKPIITGVRMGPRECNLLMPDGVTPYGLSDSSIMCKMTGTYVGNYQPIVYISGEYGTSKAQPSSMQVAANGELFAYQAYPAISNVSPTTGSTEGGTLVTITGHGFDAQPGKTTITVGGNACNIEEASSEEVKCRTPPEPASAITEIKGGRGLRYEVWNGTVAADLADLSSLTSSTSGYSSQLLDTSEGLIPNAESSGFTARLSGVFTAPENGIYEFSLTSQGEAVLSMSDASSFTNMTVIATLGLSGGSAASDMMNLEKGSSYYMEAVHKAASASGQVKIGLRRPNTDFTPTDTTQAQLEKQQLYVKPRQILEKHKVDFSAKNGSTVTFNFVYEGVASEPVTFDGTDRSEEYLEALWDLMTPKCEKTTGGSQAILQDYEDTSIRLPGQAGNHDSVTEAFCGRYSLTNSWRLYRVDYSQGKDLSFYPWLCFAYKGAVSMTGKVQVRIRYKTTDNGQRDRWFDVWDDEIVHSESWVYHCTNLFAGIEPQATDYKTGSFMLVAEIRIPAHYTGEKQIYYDEVSLTTAERSVTRVRHGARHSPDIVMRNIYVTHENLIYTLKFKAQNCLGGFTLVGIIEDGDNVTDALSNQLRSSEEVSLLLGSDAVNITRTSTASNPPTGSWSVSYNGKTVTGLAHDISGTEMKQQVETLTGAANFNLWTWGHCDNRHWIIEFTIGGDQPDFSADGSNLVFDGTTLEVGMWQERQGGLVQDVLHGDYFNTKETGNWVSVEVNDLQAACLTSDNQCSFSYDAGSTPSVSSASESLNGDGSMTISISGSGFSTTAEDNVVKVGDAMCDVTSATTTSIECTLLVGPAGVFQLKVYSADGLATMPSAGISITRTLAITSISPTTGGLGGGTSLTVTGSGLPSSLSDWSDNQVTVGGDDCPVTAATPATVTCTTPGKSSAGAESVVVTVGGETATSATSFTYDNTDGAEVTAFSPTVSLVVGGETLTIDGSRLGSEEGEVKVGDKACSVSNWTDTQIVCTIPGNNPGSYPLTVKVVGFGYAYINTGGANTITYTLKVTGMTPTKGSLLGGTKMIIEGEGFGTDCQSIDIKFGESLRCEISECTDTSIKCTTQKLPKTHVITNNGRHPVYGSGYVWEEKDVTVNLGDIVKWVWATEGGGGGGSGYAIWQTESELTNDPLDGGFNSGMEMPTGNFLQRMDKTGVTYYSGPEIQTDYHMKGSITVNSLLSEALQLHFSVHGYEAEQDTSGGSLSASLDENSCDADETGITGCSDSLPTDPNDGSFYFMSWSCSTASVTSMSILSNEVNASAPGQLLGYSGATLSVDGTGFSDQDCQNRVFLEPDIPCTTTTSSTTNIQCSVSAEMQAFKQYSIITSVFNRGNAELNLGGSVPLRFVLVPKVTSFSPTEGSTAGGFTLTIQGSGFSSQSGVITVEIGTSECTVTSISFTEIICTGGSNFAGPMDVLVKFDDTNYARTSSGAGKFTYTTTGVPVVTDISPSTVDGSVSTIAINGTSFGTDPDAVNVYIRAPASRKMREKKEDASYQRRWTYHGTMRPSPYLHIEDQIRNRGLESWKVADSRYDRRLRSTHPLAEYEQLVKVDRTLDHAPRRRLEKVRTCVDPEIMPEIMEAETYLQDQCRTVFEVIEEPVERALVMEERQDDVVHECTIQTITDTMLTCDVPDLVSGSYIVVVNNAVGNVVNQPTLTVSLSITSFSPTSGSKHGGTTITITGTGFHPDSTVSIGGSSCDVTKAQPTQITCTTSAHSGGSASVSVTTDTGSFSMSGYTYDMAITPTIDTIDPVSGAPGTAVTLSGSNFDSTGNIVKMGSSMCTVTAESVTGITFTSPNVAGGTYSVKVLTTVGYSNEINFEVPMDVTSIDPATGSFGGGNLVTVSGAGFSTDGDLTVTICDEPCVVDNVLVSSVTCTVPAATDNGGTQACDVTVTQSSGASDTLSPGWTYDSSLTPTVSGISPTRGGTAGGTVLTITGTGFAPSGNTVNIDGSNCDIQSESETEIECETSSHMGSIKAPVKVEVPGKGFADVENVDEFYYIDRWSSIFSWGGEPIPSEGEFIVIPEGNTILLDVDTARLEFLLLDGGNLVFDDEQSSVELNTKYILIVKGGSLSIGSEGNHYQNKAAINLFGTVQDVELPLFGAKVLAVRNGTLDIHGAYIPVTWTHLASTANAGDTSITLKQPVTWQAGDEIIIASTGHRHSMGENEMKTIASVSADGYTLSLETALEHDHISIEQTFCDKTIETRAEVGLLTRNVKVKGHINQDFLYDIPECPNSFDSGQFQTQSCFSGKFGEEIGYDQQGATVMMFASEPNMHWVTGRIEYAEVTHAGQAFQLGRYPIHFHLNGDITGNYVRGCAIHHTFNRAVTIHAVDGLLVERNVAYNNMGHAFFTEDGNEKNNIIQYNLAVYTRGSSSLLNVDVTPASYWLVNPQNTVRHNAAAGSTHFGYWYRLEVHPSGPSYTTDYCPNKVPLGPFYNNTAHTLGWYGLWVFSMDGYFPANNDGVDGTCSNNAPVVARYKDFLAWRCERGAEAMFGHNIRFENFVLTDNEMAGIEYMLLNGPFGSDGPGISESCIIGYSEISGQSECTERGLVTPKQFRMSVENVTFVNFDDSNCAAIGACSQCRDLQGGYEVQSKGLTFTDSPNKIGFKWTHETVFSDLDGSLTGEVGGTVLPQTDALPPSKCTFDVAAFSVNAEVPGAVCEAGVKFHRIAWNEALPQGLLFKEVALTNQYGSAMVQFKEKRLTHKNGWMALVKSGEEYEMSYINAEHLTNISYHATAYRMEPGDYMYISHNLTTLPDVIITENGDEAKKDGLPDPVTDVNGDWSFNNGTNMLTYMFSANKRALRGGPTVEDFLVDQEREINLKTVKCFFDGCVAPTLPPSPSGTPDNAVRWSDDSSWANAPEGYGGHGGVQPEEGSDIIIPADTWMVVDVALPRLNKVYIYGALEFEDSRDNALVANLILIRGGRLIAGWPATDDFRAAAQPFLHKLSIVLEGAKGSPETLLEGAPAIGAKAMGVFGKLQLIGEDVGLTWTKLGETALAGDDSIIVEDNVSWEQGQSIVVTTTNFERKENEVVVIKSVSADQRTIMLETPLQFKHLSESGASSDGSVTYSMKADVGLLSRNIKIEAGNYPQSREQSFGARVLVSRMTNNGEQFTGSAHLENVEFYHTGQDGYTDWYDPRFSLAFLNSGPSTSDSLSLVKKCAFNMNFNTAIGVFGAEDIVIEDNVIYHTVTGGVTDEGTSNVWKRNLVTSVLFPGAYDGRFEPQNIRFDCGFNVAKATTPTLMNNVVAGAERCGYRISGDACSSATHMSTNNEVHGCLHGIFMFEDDGISPCSRASNFYIWKAYDYGVFSHIVPSLVIENVVVADSYVGVLPNLYAPAALSHKYEDKTVTIKNSVFVGRSDTYECDNNLTPEIVSFNPSLTSGRTPSGGTIGVRFGSCSSSITMAPSLGSFDDPGSYPCLRLTTYLRNNTFAQFGNKCATQQDVAITSNPASDDAQHPMIASGNTFIDVDMDHRVFFFRPALNRVNPSDCVDMDCDGNKKLLIIDEDGSIVGDGTPATIIAQSEFEWDGDPRRGLGYRRVPINVFTAKNGSFIRHELITPNQGIYRGNGDCQEKAIWQAHYCNNIRHRMLVLESMDKDTEIRRLSPISITWNKGSNGYVDLINGPQDRGWCFGYTCQERISTFYLIGALDVEQEISLTSTSPGVMRLHLLNVENDDETIVKMWFRKPQRYTVYHEGSKVRANDVYTNSDGKIKYKPPGTPGLIPTLGSSQVPGENYFDRDNKVLIIRMRGPGLIEIRTLPTIMLNFGLVVDPNTFFEEEVIGNVAALLGIEEDRIRIVNVIRETSLLRTDSSDNSTNVKLQIEVMPSALSDTIPTNGNVTDTDMEQAHQEAEAAIETTAYEHQLGNLADELGFEISEFSTVRALPLPEDPPPRATPETGGDASQTGPTFSEKQQEAENAALEALLTPVVFKVAGNMLIGDQPGGFILDRLPFDQQPHLYITDTNNTVLPSVGTEEARWAIKAELHNAPKGAKLLGPTVVDVVNGWCNFTQLAVSPRGSYSLKFRVVQPAESGFVAYSDRISVRSPKLSLEVEYPRVVVKNKAFDPPVTVKIINDATKQIIDPSMQPYNWACSMQPTGAGKPPTLKGKLLGNTMSLIPSNSNEAVIDGLRISASGHLYTFRVQCKPKEKSTDTLVEELKPISVMEKEEPNKSQTFKASVRQLNGKPKHLKIREQPGFCIKIINSLDDKPLGEVMWSCDELKTIGKKDVSIKGTIQGRQFSVENAYSNGMKMNKQYIKISGTKYKVMKFDDGKKKGY